MLDKSVPYYNVIMARREKSRLNPVPLPAGFHYEFFRAGDETHWAEIETGVLEFAERSEARKYFEKEYLAYESALSERCIFISTENGQKAGTATAWWSRRKGIKIPSIHWVSIRPEFQGSGLGKAIVSRAIETSIKRDGDRDGFIHTQTWSYPAIGIYLKAGYKILREGSFGDYRNDYKEALPWLMEKMGNRFSIGRDTIALP